jgi:hypothetical protein
MATITASVLVRSESRGTWKKNLYRYTLDDGTVHEQRGWVATAVNDADDMATRGTLLLDSLARTEINGLLE